MQVRSDGRHYFTDHDNCAGRHRPGDRHDDGYGLTEWTGTAWTSICAACDVAMVARNGAGELCCGQCGGTYREVMRVG